MRKTNRQNDRKLLQYIDVFTKKQSKKNSKEVFVYLITHLQNLQTNSLGFHKNNSLAHTYIHKYIRQKNFTFQA